MQAKFLSNSFLILSSFGQIAAHKKLSELRMLSPIFCHRWGWAGQSKFHPWIHLKGRLTLKMRIIIKGMRQGKYREGLETWWRRASSKAETGLKKGAGWNEDSSPSSPGPPSLFVHKIRPDLFLRNQRKQPHPLSSDTISWASLRINTICWCQCQEFFYFF